MQTLAPEPSFKKILFLKGKPNKVAPFVDKWCKISADESTKRLQGAPIGVGDSNAYQLALSAVKKNIFAANLFDEAEIIADQFQSVVNEKRRQCHAEFQNTIGSSLQSAPKSAIITAEKKRIQCSNQFAWDMDDGLMEFKQKGCDISDISAFIKLVLSQRRKSYNVTDYTGAE